MSGVSVGWFDPAALNADTLIPAIKKLIGPRLRRTKAWPLAVSSIRWHGKGTGVAYAMIGGAIPVHIDTVGLDDSDGRIFQFVLEVENRPAIFTSPQTPNADAIFHGFAPPTKPQTFLLGGMELKRGMAVHFDITATWHGVTGLPVEMESTASDLSPRAVIVQVAGFGADQIGDAMAQAAYWISADILASSK